MDFLPLSQREFDTWREDDRAFKDDMRAFMESQTRLNLDYEGRLSTVEAKQDDCESTINRRSGMIAGLVAAVIGGFGTWLAAKFGG